MYSKRISSLLKKAGAEEGDRVKVTKDSESYEGILMPKSQGDENCIVLKLKSGYNVGIDCSSKEVKVELVKKGSKRPTKPEKPAPAGKGSLTILGCGGTLASKVEYQTGAVYPSMTESELLSAVPELKDMGPISSHFLFLVIV